MKGSINERFKKLKDCTFCIGLILVLVLVPTIFGALLAAWSTF